MLVSTSASLVPESNGDNDQSPLDDGLTCSSGDSDYASEIISELGIALTAQDNIVRLLGLDSSFMGELIEFHSTEEGLTLNLALDDSSIAVLGREDTIVQGEVADRTYEEVLVPVGFGVLGTVLSPLGHPYIIYE